jgi:hypothetical protein
LRTLLVLLLKEWLVLGLKWVLIQNERLEVGEEGNLLRESGKTILGEIK